MRFYIYNNSGGIKEVKNRDINLPFQGYYWSIETIFLLYDKYPNLRLCLYGFDDRIMRNVYILTGDHSRRKNQFLSFIIEDKEKENETKQE